MSSANVPAFDPVLASSLLDRFHSVPSVGPAASSEVALEVSDLPALLENAYVHGLELPATLSYSSSEEGVESESKSLARDIVDQARESADPLIALWVDHLDCLKLRSDALRSHDAQIISDVSSSLFGIPKPDLLSSMSQRLLAGDLTAARISRPLSDMVCAQQAAQALQAGLDVLLERLECSDPWAVVIVPHMSARMSVVPLRREVRVSRAASFLTAEVSRLAVHEIATHVARSVAGYAHVHPMLAIGLHPHHLHDEEGLAVWVEGELGVSSDESLRTYLLRALAVQCALEGSYLDTYALMRKYTSAEQAAAITLRVKRGIASTSAPGAFTKDHVYLTGSAAVSKYLASDRSGLAALFSGKVSLGMLGLFEQLRRASLASLSPIDPLEMALSVRVAASEQLCAS